MAKKKGLIGKEVKLVFLDHVKDSDRLILCEIWGRVVGETEEQINIAVWDLPECDAESRYHNQERYTIIKSAIKEIKVFR